MAASWAEGVYCAMEYRPAPVGSALKLAGGSVEALGRAWMAVAEPCVSWLSVCSAKRACAWVAMLFMGLDVIRNPVTGWELRDARLGVQFVCGSGACAGAPVESMFSSEGGRFILPV